MAAVFDRGAALPAPVAAVRIASIKVIADMATAEPIWRQFEADGALMTPYQGFDFQDAWHRHVGMLRGVEPFIVVAFDADTQPVMLMPLGLKTEHGVRVARFFGGKHVTFNMPLYRRNFAGNATAADLEHIIGQLRGLPGGPDVLALNRQPLRWTGVTNPLSLLPHQAAPSTCPVLTITPGDPPHAHISNSIRRRLARKERKLQALPGYRYDIVSDDAAITHTLDTFFALKPLRLAGKHIRNTFAEPGIEDFIRDACMRKVRPGHVIELHALTCDDEVIATVAGVARGERFSMMFNTYTMSANARFSPGLVLMRNVIDHHAQRGTRALDIGVGSDSYKRFFCKDEEPLFDSYLPLTARGRVAAAAMASLARIKRRVKQHAAVTQAARALRNALRL